jgi:hypothetical protein
MRCGGDRRLGQACFDLIDCHPNHRLDLGLGMAGEGRWDDR